MNATDVGRGALWLIWKSLSLSVFILLATLEPVVSFVLGSLALLGVLTALFFKLIGAPHFPFVAMLATSLGLGLLRIGCRALLRAFTG